MYKLKMTTNEYQAHLLNMYCEGRSFIWNMFFGWRMSKKLNTDVPEYYYRVPKKIWELTEKLFIKKKKEK